MIEESQRKGIQNCALSRYQRGRYYQHQRIDSSAE